MRWVCRGDGDGCVVKARGISVQSKWTWSYLSVIYFICLFIVEVVEVVVDMEDR